MGEKPTGVTQEDHGDMGDEEGDPGSGPAPAQGKHPGKTTVPTTSA